MLHDICFILTKYCSTVSKWMNNCEIRGPTLIILLNRRKVPETSLKIAASVRHCDTEQIACVTKTVDLIIKDFFIKLKGFIITSICHVIFHGHAVELGYNAMKGN